MTDEYQSFNYTIRGVIHVPKDWTVNAFGSGFDLPDGRTFKPFETFELGNERSADGQELDPHDLDPDELAKLGCVYDMLGTQID